MNEPLDVIVERARHRKRWFVERESTGNGHYRVRSGIDRILTEGLSQMQAEALADTYNAVLDDAVSLVQEESPRVQPLRLAN